MGAADHDELKAAPDGEEVMRGTAEAWDKAADGYRMFGSVRSAAGLKAARLQQGEAVLDVGTGPGATRPPPHPQCSLECALSNVQLVSHP